MNLRTRILAALAESDMDAHNLAEVCCCAYRSLYNGQALKLLRADGSIHVAAWRRADQTGGKPRPIFRLGAGQDARRPTPLPSSAKAMAYRKRHRARINKAAKISKYLRRGRTIVEAIDPLLAALMRPIATQPEERTTA